MTVLEQGTQMIVGKVHATCLAGSTPVCARTILTRLSRCSPCSAWLLTFRWNHRSTSLEYTPWFFSKLSVSAWMLPLVQPDGVGDAVCPLAFVLKTGSDVGRVRKW